METNIFTNREINPFDKGRNRAGYFRWVLGIIALFLLGTGSVNAQQTPTIIVAAGAAANAPWNNNNTWANPNGTAAGRQPGTNDVVEITAGRSVSYNVAVAAGSYTCAGLIIHGNGATLTYANGAANRALRISGDIDVYDGGKIISNTNANWSPETFIITCSNMNIGVETTNGLLSSFVMGPYPNMTGASTFTVTISSNLTIGNCNGGSSIADFSLDRGSASNQGTFTVTVGGDLTRYSNGTYSTGSGITAPNSTVNGACGPVITVTGCTVTSPQVSIFQGDIDATTIIGKFDIDATNTTGSDYTLTHILLQPIIASGYGSLGDFDVFSDGSAMPLTLLDNGTYGGWLLPIGHLPAEITVKLKNDASYGTKRMAFINSSSSADDNFLTFTSTTVEYMGAKKVNPCASNNTFEANVRNLAVTCPPNAGDMALSTTITEASDWAPFSVICNNLASGASVSVDITNTDYFQLSTTNASNGSGIVSVPYTLSSPSEGSNTLYIRIKQGADPTTPSSLPTAGLTVSTSGKTATTITCDFTAEVFAPELTISCPSVLKLEAISGNHSPISLVFEVGGFVLDVLDEEIEVSFVDDQGAPISDIDHPFYISDNNIAVDGSGFVSGTIEVKLDATTWSGPIPSVYLSLSAESSILGAISFTGEQCEITGEILPFIISLTPSPETYCTGQIITLTAGIVEGGEPEDYTYNFSATGGVTPISFTATSLLGNEVTFIAPAAAGNHLDVTVTVINTLTTEAVPKTITLDRATDGCPSVLFNTTTTVSFCPGKSFTINATPTPSNDGGYDITYKWTGGISGESYTGTAASTLPGDNGATFTITAYANDEAFASETYTLQSSITYLKPLAPSLGANIQACEDDPIIIKATYAITGYVDEIASYIWFNTNEEEEEEEFAEVTSQLQFTFDGSAYSITVIAVDICGNEGNYSDAKLVTEGNNCVDGCGSNIFEIKFLTSATAPISFTTTGGTACSDCSYINSGIAAQTGTGASSNALGYSLTSTNAPFAIGSVTYPSTRDGHCFIYNTGNPGSATITPRDMFALYNVPALSLLSNVSYLLEFNYMSVGANTANSGNNASGTFTIGNVTSVPFKNYANDGSVWRSKDGVLTSSARSQLAATVYTNGLIATCTPNVSASGSNGPALAFDNIKLIPLCEPTFNVDTVAGTSYIDYCTAGKPTVLNIKPTKGYDIKNSVDSIIWYKKSLIDGSLTPLDTIKKYERTGAVPGAGVNYGTALYPIKWVMPDNYSYTIATDAKGDAHAIYVAEVYGKGYAPVSKSIAFNCQTATITSNRLALCDDGNDQTTLTANLLPVVGGLTYTYVWQKRPLAGGRWSTIAGNNSSTYIAQEEGEYHVIITVEYPGGDVFTKTSEIVAVEIVPGTTLTWKGINSDWNDKANWNDGSFAPRACDKVVIPEPDRVDSLPILATPAFCDNIHFEHGAAIGGQIQDLTYITASADMTIHSTPLLAAPNGPRWYMLAPAFKNASSHDYIVDGYMSYMRYFFVENGETSWTAALSGDLSLSAGQGIVYRAARMPATASETAEFFFEDKRFIIEESNCVYDKAKQLYKLKVDLSKSNGGNSPSGNEYEGESDYVMVGNPFMSYLNVDTFLKHNSTVLEEIALADIKVYESLAKGFATSASGPASSAKWIAPFQAFFVKPHENYSGIIPDELNLEFTATMLDAKVESDYRLRGLSVLENTLHIRATQGGYTSFDAVVRAKEGASNSFNSNEDATKLFSSESPLEVSTLVDGKACDVNVLNRDLLNELLVPISIKSTKAGTITLEISGAVGFTAADNIYLFDALTQTSVSLLDRSTFDIPEDAENIDERFFLQFFKQEIEEPITKVDNFASGKLYIGAQQGNVVVEARDEQILQVTVYDISGRKVLETGKVNSTVYSAKLPGEAAYFVKVVTDKQVKTGKVIVK